MNLYEIACIIFPPTRYADSIELFVRHYNVLGSIKDRFCKLNKYTYNTWMNTFAAKKYYHYCDLGNIYLKLKIKGSYRINIIGSNRNSAFGIEDSILVDQCCENDIELKVPCASKYEALYFTLYEEEDNPVMFYDGAWCTDRVPNQQNILAIVTCTFKRESYVYTNMRVFSEFLERKPELKGRIKYVVVDNGKTVDITKATTDIQIYQNINAGGAGGFSRGLMEVQKNDPSVTRVLFMDDDVEIFPESFHKTLLLSDYLKDVYKNSFINGAMLDIYDKTNFFENLAIQDKLWVRSPFSNISLKDYGSILFINDIAPDLFQRPDAKADSAWWYHCFSMEMAKVKGLPMPIFFRGDDVEWSWRNYGKHHISMNGICVWHSPFIWRVSPVAEYYYLPRNMFFINSIYTDNFKEKFPDYFKSTFKYLIKTYNYHGIDIFFRAIHDILRGAETFRENPEVQFKSVNAINKKENYYSCQPWEIDAAFRYKNHVHKWEKLLYRWTHHGLQAPKFLFKKSGKAMDWYPPVENFMFKKEVRVYNPLSRQCEVRKFHRKKSIAYENEFKLLLHQLMDNYDRLHNEFVTAHKEFTTMEFWEKYLGV